MVCFFPPLPVSAKLSLIHMREIKNIKRTRYLRYLFEWHSVKLQGEINLFSYFNKIHIFLNANPSVPQWQSVFFSDRFHPNELLTHGIHIPKYLVPTMIMSTSVFLLNKQTNPQNPNPQTTYSIIRLKC